MLKTHILSVPNDVKWGDLPPSLIANPAAKFAVVEGDPKVAGQLFAIRLKFPDGYKINPHFHPADEHVVVLQGSFNMGMGDKFDDKATTALPVGGFGVMPKDHHHFAMAKGETIIQVYAIGPWGLTYVNPSDDPRNAPKKP